MMKLIMIVILLVIFIKNINSSYISITRSIIRMMKSDSKMYNTINTMVTPTITTRTTTNNNNNVSSDTLISNNMINNNDDNSNNTNNVYEKWSSPSALDGMWRTIYSDIDNKITGRDYVDLFDNTTIGVVNTLPLSRLTLSPPSSLWAVINSTTQVVLSLLSLLSLSLLPLILTL